MTAAEVLRGAALRARANDMAGALAEAEHGLAAHPFDPALLAFAALAALRVGETDKGIALLRRQLAAVPGDAAARINLATALARGGRNAEALAVARDHGGHPRLARLAGFLLQDAGEPAGAAAAYAAALAADPGDFESWNNLANCRSALGELSAAAAAFERAINAAPQVPAEVFINLCELLAKMDNREGRLRAAEEAVRRHPDHAGAQLALGLAMAAAGRTEAALETLGRAARREEEFGEAGIEYGLLLENTNRLDALEALVARAEARSDAPEIAFLKAWALRRRERFADAAREAARIPATINPIRTAQLRAEIADRTGDPATAWREFSRMNRAVAEAFPARDEPSYRQRIETETAALAPLPSLDARPCPGERPDPVFIVGFPRSGTTLLNTLLSALPELEVLEEQPFLGEVEAAFPGLAAETAALRVAAARARYFELAEAAHPAAAGRRIVDKHPLHMTHLPTIRRLFPDAAIVFVERHPCDVVLSCYMANFVMNSAMRSFTDIEEAARTYDAVMANWERALELVPVPVHRLRYELLVADIESEMRALLDRLGLPWRDAVLDNQEAARGRGLIRTASYAQVGQPLYARAAGRWQRYRRWLEPVLPLLRPWAERMGYQVPPSP